MEIYMYKKVLSSAIGLLVSTQVMAQSYQFEGNAGYTIVNPVGAYEDSIKDYHLASLNGTYYFTPVKTENHPLQEAAFLEKNSSLSLAYQNSQYTTQYSYLDVDAKSSSTYSAFILNAETYLLNDFISLSGLIAEDKSEDKTTIKTNGNTPYTTKDKESDEFWRLNLGIAPLKNLLVWSEFEKDIDVSQSWNLNAKYVMEFSNKALNLQGGFGHNAITTLLFANNYPTTMKLNFSGFDSDDESSLNSIYLLGDYYFDKSLSVGLGASHMDDDETFSDTYMIRTKKFFTDRFSVQVQYGTSDVYDTYSVVASMRF
jgi:hypothetical protein